MGVPAKLGVSASGRSPYWPAENLQANAVVQGTLAAVRASKAFAMFGPMNLWLWASFTTSITIVAGTLSADVGAAGALAAGTSISTPLLPYGTTMSAIGGGGGVTTTLVLPIYTYWAKTKTGIPVITGLASTQWLLGAAVSGPGIQVGTTVIGIPVPAIVPSGTDPGRRGTVQLSLPPTSASNEDVTAPFEFTLNVAALVAGVDTAAVFTGAAIVFNATVQLERCFDGGGLWLPCNIGANGQLAQWSGATTTPVSISFGEPEKMILYRLNALSYTGISGTTLNFRMSETGQAATTLAVPTLA